MTQLATLDPFELVRDAPALGSPPVVYRKLVEVLQNPRSGAREVAAVITQDTALTARLLRIANSAYFAPSSPIESVQQAVTLVGAAHVRDMALATSVTSFFRDVPPDLIHLEDFWRHSLAVGIGARMLAKQRREVNVERFFVAGMLHDVGRLVMYISASDAARAILEHAEEHECLLYEAEMELVGFDHGTIGGALMRQWNMPESLVECVALHHRPAEAEVFPVETAAIHLADLVANSLQLGRSGERLVPPRWPEVWDALELDPTSLPDLMTAVQEEYEEVVGAFGF